MNLEDVLLRGTRASQPGAGTVAEGTLYFVTDEGVIEQSLSSAWVSYSDTSDAGITQLTGDVTAGPGSGSQAATIANDAVTTAKILDDNVTNAKLADVATATFKGRTTAGTGNPEDLTATQATALLNNLVGDSGAGGTKGLVPAPAAGDAAASKFLKADATWATPAGGGASDWDSETEKAATDTITNTTTMTSDSELIKAVTAGKIYHFEALIIYDGTSSSVEYKFGMVVSSGNLDGWWSAWGFNAGDAMTNFTGSVAAASSWANGSAMGTAGSTQERLLWVRGMMRPTASANITWQAAEFTAGVGTNCRTKIGSLWRWKQITP